MYGLELHGNEGRMYRTRVQSLSFVLGIIALYSLSGAADDNNSKSGNAVFMPLMGQREGNSGYGSLAPASWQCSLAHGVRRAGGGQRPPVRCPNSKDVVAFGIEFAAMAGQGARARKAGSNQ